MAHITIDVNFNDAGFEESSHPRGTGGKFTSQGAATKVKDPLKYVHVGSTATSINKDGEPSKFGVTHTVRNRYNAKEHHHVTLDPKSGEIISHTKGKTVSYQSVHGERDRENVESDIGSARSSRLADVHSAIQQHLKKIGKLVAV